MSKNHKFQSYIFKQIHKDKNLLVLKSLRPWRVSGRGQGEGTMVPLVKNCFERNKRQNQSR